MHMFYVLRSTIDLLRTLPQGTLPAKIDVACMAPLRKLNPQALVVQQQRNNSNDGGPDASSAARRRHPPHTLRRHKVTALCPVSQPRTRAYY